MPFFRNRNYANQNYQNPNQNPNINMGAQQTCPPNCPCRTRGAQPPQPQQAGMWRTPPPAPQSRQAGQPQPQQPYHDPSVRFEPMPQNMPVPGMPHPQAPPNPVAAPNEVLKKFAQGEVNSLTYYENLASSAGASEHEKAQVQALLTHKRKTVKKLGGGEPSSNGDAVEIPDFRAGVGFALQQEAEQLREASAIYADCTDGSQLKGMTAMLYDKVADIAHLMSI